MEEVFVPIKGFEDKYLVSNLGNVKSICNYHNHGERILKQYNHANTKYVFVCLSCGYDKNKKRTKYKCIDVHRLVAQAFIPNPKNFPEINHKDENPKNNCSENLEWCTAKYNSNYGTLKSRQSKKVLMCDKQSGNILEEFYSINSAAKYVNGYSGNISSCCSGKLDTAYGYKWKYKTECRNCGR